MQNNQNQAKPDYRTYWDYLKLGENNTKPFLMIAELIDNAISSFDNHYRNTNWNNQKLKIFIEINCEGPTQNINGIETINKSYIKVSDNGFGMSQKELEEAVILNRRNSSFSKMNVHGRGLKQSVFFFGVDLEIETKNVQNESWKIEQKLSQQTSVDSKYLILAKKTFKKDRGTTVKIGNIRKDRQISLTSWDRIKETLEYRYIKFFEKNKLQIDYIFNGKCGSFQQTSEPVAKIADAYDDLEKEKTLCNLMDITEKNVLKNIQKRKERYGNMFDEQTVLKAFNVIKGLLEKSKLDNWTKFWFEITLLINNRPLLFSFWLLPQKNFERSEHKRYSSYRGIRFFEGERAITHAGDKYVQTRLYMDWKYTTMETGSTENVFAGSCDLSEIGIQTKTDKSSFNFTDIEEEDLKKQIFSVWIAFDNFVILARKKEKGAKPSDLEYAKLASIAPTKFPSEYIEYLGYESDQANKKSVWRYKSVSGDDWTIDISVDDNDNKEVFHLSCEPDKKIVFTVFTKHKFWVRMSKLNKDFYIEAVLPISLLLIIHDIHWREGFGFQGIKSVNANANRLF